MAASRSDNLFDKRIVQRNLKRGKLTRKEYDQYMGNLPDVSSKAISMFEEEKSRAKEEGEG